MEEIIKFLRENSKRYKTFDSFNDDQLAIYVYEHCKNEEVCGVWIGGKLEAMCFFKPYDPRGFYIRQLFGRSSKALKLLIETLHRKFPNVTEVYGTRSNSKLVKFPVTKLHRLYAR